MSQVFIDIHCHPTMKPYGQSFPGKIQDSDRKNNSCIWYYNPPTLADKILNNIGGLSRYSQANFTAQNYGNVGIIGASLYPIEVGFLKNKLGTGDLSNALSNFVTGLGRARIDFVEHNTNYFDDLMNEYKFLQQLDGSAITLDDNRTYKYVLVKNYADIQSALNSSVPTLAVMVSFEGGHSFRSNISPEISPSSNKNVLDNVLAVKNWKYKPLFITLAHHFYNGLCGHAKSLTGIMAQEIDQSYKIDTGFTELGKLVVRSLLDNTDGKRILIDIKHMSKKARGEYFDMLNTDYKDENIPLIVSHGGVTGNNDNNQLFNTADINFSDDEILEVGKRFGLFGIQLDKRRIASPTELENIRGEILRKKILYNWARLVWRQVQHIGEILDTAGLFAWGMQTLGTDYDGMIDPLGGYWSSEEMEFMDNFLLMHAYNYMNTDGKNMQQARNKISPEEIVNRFMGDNTIGFLSKNY